MILFLTILLFLVAIFDSEAVTFRFCSLLSQFFWSIFLHIFKLISTFYHFFLSSWTHFFPFIYFFLQVFWIFTISQVCKFFFNNLSSSKQFFFFGFNTFTICIFFLIFISLICKLFIFFTLACNFLLNFHFSSAVPVFWRYFL